MADETRMPKSEDYPSNSFKSRGIRTQKHDETEKPPETHVVAKVTTGKIVKKKKNFLDNFAETFFGDDAHSVAMYVLHDVLIPAAKETLSDMVSGGIEMLLFGRTRGTGRSKSGSYVSYGSYYKNRDRQLDSPSRKTRATHQFNEVILESRQEADDVLAGLVELIDAYDVATVADFYDLVGIESSYADEKYGWTNLSRAVSQRVREGYILLLPKPSVID